MVSLVDFMQRGVSFRLKILNNNELTLIDVLIIAGSISNLFATLI